MAAQAELASDVGKSLNGLDQYADAQGQQEDAVEEGPEECSPLIVECILLGCGCVSVLLLHLLRR